ncbi:unknown [Clostridium sp. CAG:448]|nr:unknown [Clostridium sp. CAG:448]
MVHRQHGNHDVLFCKVGFQRGARHNRINILLGQHHAFAGSGRSRGKEHFTEFVSVRVDGQHIAVRKRLLPQFQQFPEREDFLIEILSVIGINRNKILHRGVRANGGNKLVVERFTVYNGGSVNARHELFNFRERQFFVHRNGDRTASYRRNIGGKPFRRRIPDDNNPFIDQFQFVKCGSRLKDQIGKRIIAHLLYFAVHEITECDFLTVRTDNTAEIACVKHALNIVFLQSFFVVRIVLTVHIFYSLSFLCRILHVGVPCGILCKCRNIIGKPVKNAIKNRKVFLG